MFKHQLLGAAATVLCVGMSNVSSAGETPWFETDGGNLRVLIQPFMPGATTVRGVIDIDLLPGWKTYWRDPGSGGIPPSIQIIGNDNISVQEINYPAPKWIESDYGDYAGYDLPVEIPFVLKTDAPLTDTSIAARILVGICSDICIPAFADFQLPVTQANGSSKTAIEVDAAFAALPKTPAEMDMTVKTLPSNDQSLEVEVTGDVDNLQFFVSGRSGEQFAQPEIIAQSGQSVRYKIAPLRAFKDNQLVDVMVTGINKSGAFETSKQIQFNAP